MTLINNIDKKQLKGIGIPLAILSLLAMVTVPLPPFFLDLFFTFNIVLSLIVLFVTIYAKKPLDFAIFPTVILITTLFRLSLNIASTRVILLEGHVGGNAAGNVIEAFGEFVIGGNYAVGLVVFAILVTINFVVITKGAGRVAEVGARFTLDSMPGKQMAVDADLNAGLITQEEAQLRRREISRESEFYGAMDGASKFVKGDAVAGIIILFINLIGGLAIGMAQHDLGFSLAVETYTLLTLGDGLVAQIPALLLSTATAIIVTRVSSEDDSTDLGEQLNDQMLSNPKTLYMVSGILAVVGIIPGMPNLSFLSFAAIVAAAAYFLSKKSTVAEAVTNDEIMETETEKPKEVSWGDIDEVDRLGLEIGYRHIALLDDQSENNLLDRVRGLRRKLSQELGFLIPSIHIRDNLDSDPNTYKIVLMGVAIEEGVAYSDKELAIVSGEVYDDLEGIPTKEPAYNMDAIWVEKEAAEDAEALGYTVVDPSTVIATHISKVIKNNASELIGQDDVQNLVDRVKERSPKLIENLIPEKITLSGLTNILQRLLREQVSIKDINTILESITKNIDYNNNPAELTQNVRVALGRQILQDVAQSTKSLKVITLEPPLEQILLKASSGGLDGHIAVDPNLVENFHPALKEQAETLEDNGDTPVLLVAPQIRNQLSKLLRHSIPDLKVLSYSEIPEDKDITVAAVIGQGR
jgi:flagellar biosynthesis protein FlhA